MRLAYIRVSKVTVRQLIEADRTSKDHVRSGDIVICHNISRLASNLLNLKELITFFTGKAVSVQFIKEAITCSTDKQKGLQIHIKPKISCLVL